MKIIYKLGGKPVTVYSFEFCHYGESGDYEVFPDGELDLDLSIIMNRLSAGGYDTDFAAKEVLIFSKSGVEYTLFDDGRLIIEGLAPGSCEQALETAVSIVGYEK
jgi:hypothetical protein